MSRYYRFGDHDRPHFITLTVVGWIDFFIRDEYRNIFAESIQYCQQHKGLVVYGYCLMPSHAHLIIGRNGDYNLDEILRDFKAFTSQSFHKIIPNTMKIQESRKEWMLPIMERFGIQKKHNKGFQFWQQHNKPIEIWSPEVFDQKLSYIHYNPVASGFVGQPEHWLFSSARNYANMSAPIKIVYG
jgi:REP element-mobilizing transposase RayT